MVWSGFWTCIWMLQIGWNCGSYLLMQRRITCFNMSFLCAKRRVISDDSSSYKSKAQLKLVPRQNRENYTPKLAEWSQCQILGCRVANQVWYDQLNMKANQRITNQWHENGETKKNNRLTRSNLYFQPLAGGVGNINKFEKSKSTSTSHFEIEIHSTSTPSTLTSRQIFWDT